MNILIAEDQRIIQKIHQLMLENWGFNVDIASNGAKAVEISNKKRGVFDLCIMDVSMPVMNGIEATRAIRKSQPYFPIMGYTSAPDYRDQCLQAGMDEVTLKPCQSNHLFEIIKELTSKPLAINVSNGALSISKVMPMNQEELQELRELKKQGLTKLKLVGLGHSFVVHKNIQNKISHDLIGQSKELSEFIDRSPSEPGRCHLYKANLHVTKDLFLPTELDEAIQKEDEIAARYDSATDENSGTPNV
ncbi:MAG: response regulator [Candidatus Thiodiazotropha sp.]